MCTLRGLIVLVVVGIVAATGEPQQPKDNKLPDKAKAILDKAEQFDLISLEPRDREKVKDGFRGWQVLGSTVVKDAKDRKKVLDAVYGGIADGKNGARCFDPRHGIRATADGATVELVICFECSWVYVFYDKDGKREATLVTSGGPQATLDQVLKTAGVPLSKPPGK